MRVFCLFTIPAILILAGCSGSSTLTGRWLDRDISIDGKLNDWDYCYDVFAAENLEVGVFNDEEAIYISVSAGVADLNSMQMHGNMVLWLSTGGSEHKTLGLRCVPMRSDGRLGGNEMRRDFGAGDVHDGLSPQIDMVDLEGVPLPVEILRREDEPGNIVSLDELPGVEIVRNIDRGGVSYEYRIPLCTDASLPVCLDAVPGEWVNLCLQTFNREPSMDSDMMARARAEGKGGMGGGRGGGMGGGMGGGRGGAGGMRGGRAGASPSLNKWFAVELFSDPNTVEANTGNGR